MARLTLLQSLETQLKTITPANGYNTAIGELVTYWDTYEHDYKGAASVTFRDVNTDYEWANTRQTNRLTVELEAIAFSTKSSKLQLSCHLMDDIYQAVCVVPWWENVIAVRPLSDNKEMDAGGKQAVCVTLTVEIEYRD